MLRTRWNPQFLSRVVVLEKEMQFVVPASKAAPFEVGDLSQEEILSL